MVALTSLANVLNYGSSLVFSRILEPVGFGELTSLLALSVVLAVPLGAAQTVVAERVAAARLAGDGARVRWLVRYALGHVAVLGLGAGLLYAAAIPIVIDVFGIREPGPAIALVPLVVFSFVAPVTLGVLQGLERFVALGTVLFAISASRLLFGVPWAVAGGGPGGAIAGQALGLIFVHLVAAYVYRDMVLEKGSGVAKLGMRRSVDVAALAASGAFIGFALLSSFDVILARLYLDGDQAGIYAAVSTIAKVLVFLPGAIAFVIVPHTARAVRETGTGLSVLRRAGRWIALACLLFAVPAVIFPGHLVSLMFGQGYGAASEAVLPAVISGSALAFLNLLCVYSVTVRDRRWLVLLVLGVGLQVVLIHLMGHSPVGIAWAQMIAVTVVLLANELWFHPLARPAEH